MSNTGLGTSPFSAHGDFTYIAANKINNAINDNYYRITTSLNSTIIDGGLSDGNYSAAELITDINGGQTIELWDLVYYDVTQAEWMIADADVSGKAPAWGIAVGATSNGDTASVMVRGFVNNSNWDWTPGAVLYLASSFPSSTPSASPSEGTPSSTPSSSASSSPSASPSEGTPSASPTSPSGSPSGSPSASPTSPSESPSTSPSSSPSGSPSTSPSGSPSTSPSASPSGSVFDGNLTETAPSSAGSVVQPVGRALTADIVYFNFNPVSGFGVL